MKSLKLLFPKLFLDIVVMRIYFVGMRVTTPERLKEEEEVEYTLRPRRLDEFVGQSKIKNNLGVAIEATKRRGQVLDHVLFFGPPGLGKTTLAYIISKELGVNITTTTGPVVERPADLAGMLTRLGSRDIFFIDEIHRLGKAVQEYLYPAMEEFRIEWLVDQGPNARSVSISLIPFTLVGATTRLGLLSAPLRSRFDLIFRLDFYSPVELQEIVLRSAKILGISIDTESSMEIAKRARGTPRIANRLLKRVRDYAEVKEMGAINLKITQFALSQLDVDELGLDELDKSYLLTIIDKYHGGPVGVKTIAASIAEDPQTIEEKFEPYLLQLGFIKRTSKGREATPLAYQHLGRKRTKTLF